MRDVVARASVSLRSVYARVMIMAYLLSSAPNFLQESERSALDEIVAAYMIACKNRVEVGNVIA